MSTKPKLQAALTTTGLILSLTLPAAAAAPSSDVGTRDTETLSQRVDRLKAKARASMQTSGDPARHGVIENIVQFFNFRNR